MRSDAYRWWFGSACGVAAVVAITFGVAAVPADTGTALPALLLVVPVALTAWQWGTAASIVTASGAAIAQAYAFLPPIRSVRVHIAQDVGSLTAFLGVAAIIGIVSARRAPRRTAVVNDEVLLRSVSHDLRTPLGTIHAVSTDLRSDTPYDPTTRRALLDLVIAESERLDRIVGTLLSATRPADGPAAVTVVDLAAAAKVVATRLGRDRPTPIHVHLPPELRVAADPVRVDQLLSNLVENALRHTPAASTISITGRAGRRGIEVHVVDDGPGIPRRRRQQLFRPVEPGGTSSAGLGLGLSLCRSIVEAEGGSIAVRAAPGRGTDVRVTLPRAG